MAKQPPTNPTEQETPAAKAPAAFLVVATFAGHSGNEPMPFSVNGQRVDMVNGVETLVPAAVMAALEHCETCTIVSKKPA